MESETVRLETMNHRHYAVSEADLQCCDSVGRTSASTIKHSRSDAEQCRKPKMLKWRMKLFTETSWKREEQATTAVR